MRASLPARARPSGCGRSSTATWQEYDHGLTSTDPLKFTDTKPYHKRLDASIAATGLNDAVITATGRIDGIETVVAAMEYRFIGGSMGVVVGEKITRAIERAIAGTAAGHHRVVLRAARA